jgi:hypothetical protein
MEDTTMALPRVFIASSSEGLQVAEAVRGLLLKELGDTAEIVPWTRQFGLSEVTIESLEKASSESDFAVLVLTPDDITTGRGKKTPAPRDNVVFELGLFLGRLGRERCFVVCGTRPKLKLPSDLLGLTVAAFEHPSANDLKVVLATPCFDMRQRIEKLGIRRRFSAAALAAQAATNSFCERVTGAWWERLVSRDPGGARISFFEIEPDAPANSVCLRGKSYNEEGTHVSNWDSVMARVDVEARQLLYLWKGWHPQSDLTHLTFHGFGEMDFDRPRDSSGPINRGEGKFWVVDEADPSKTMATSIEIRRILDDKVARAMTAGTEKSIRSSVVKALDEW